MESETREIIISHCDECFASILAGDLYYKIKDMTICEDCINECAQYAEPSDEYLINVVEFEEELENEQI